jgi:8-oxo-dGTP pyrophosphatase MutT (NUDIX family)
MARGWKRVSSEPFHDHPGFRLLSEGFVSGRTGATIDALVVDAPHWVSVLPVTSDGQFVLIRQFRFGSNVEELEVPGGLVDPGEDPIVAAARELREETGYRCERITSLGSVSPNPAFMRNRLHYFVAEGCVLEGEQEQDPGEDIAVELHSLASIDALIARGGLDHALAQLAFYRLALLRAGHTFG